MQKIKLISVGKTKEKWLEDAINEYIKRLSPYLEFEFIWAKDDIHLVKLVEKEKNVICLDVEGTLYSSESFAKYILESLEQGGSRLTLVIGGAEGLPFELKTKHSKISLSPMTFTHQCTRLILIEQIYRAFELAKGSKYHK
mgnify:CR=1 FL=1